MIKISHYCIVNILVIIIAGCASAISNTAVSDQKGIKTSSTTSSAVTTSDAPTKVASVDSKANQAKQYCDHEIERSALQPPDILNKKQIQACVLASRSVWNNGCGDGVAKKVTLTLIIDKSGEVIDSFATGENSDSPESVCVANKMKKIKFPTFKGKNQMEIKNYPITFIE